MIEPFDYKLPFDDRISGGLRIGSILKLEGLILEQSKRFCIQIADGQHDRARALQIKATLDNPSYMAIYVRNCFGERSPVKHFSLIPNRRFDVEIQVTHNTYKIFTNGKNLGDFRHCLPPKEAIFLRMDGDVILEKVTVP